MDEKVDDQRSEVSDLVYNGRLKALNKWEFANQIGSVALHHQKDKGTCILVGQPGGTVSKISNIRMAGDTSESTPTQSSIIEQGFSNATASNFRSRNPSSASGATYDVEHYSLNLGNIQNPNTPTEVVGNVSPFGHLDKCDHYAVATLDGTVMLCHEDSFEM